MRTRKLILGLAGVAGAWLAGGGQAAALERSGYELTVVVDGAARPEYSGPGRTYVEAVRGLGYTLHLSNPTPYRIAVALSVDGLNTIDARRTTPSEARKWVIEPYGSVEISGWQVSDAEARRFYFTGERGSYGAWLGKTANLGVIEAVVFRERRRRPPVYVEQPPFDRDEDLRDLGYLDGGVERERRADEARREAPRGLAPALAAPSGSAESAGRTKQRESLSDDYAATGIGSRSEHQIRWVDLDLEPNPAAVLSIRYEFRPALVRLGVFPREHGRAPLERRESARGFCPDPW
jgi:hypothetical protein